MVLMLRGSALVPGTASGSALVSDEPLSFWGGYDYLTGEIIDRRHPLSGSIGAGRVLTIPYSRGSSSTTAVLLEAVRAGTAPSAILTDHDDSFFALASIVAGVLYDKQFPVIALSSSDFRKIKTGDRLAIEPDGTVIINS
jgi:predicted aconitase with swiveling domain